MIGHPEAFTPGNGVLATSPDRNAGAHAVDVDVDVDVDVGVTLSLAVYAAIRG